mgnify:CR=1 FL=1
MASTDSSGLPCVGKILIVDDKYDDAVKTAVTQLVARGLAVHYWNGSGDFPETILNVRVVILDLDLLDLKTRPAGPEAYYPAAEALSKIPGPFLVAIMALDCREEDPSSLKEVFEEYYDLPFPGFVVKKGLTKDEVCDEPVRIVRLISEAIVKQKILNLIVLWELVLDRAKDLGMKHLVQMGIEPTIVGLIRSICEESGEESAARELVTKMMRLVSRSLHGKEYAGLDNLIRELNRSAPSVTKTSLLYNRLKFYRLEEKEPIWTGDIYRTVGEKKYDQYAIVLTPTCDLAQGKATSVLACFAFPLKEEFLEDPEYPPYAIDSYVREKRAKSPEPSRAQLAQLVKKRYFLREGLPTRFYAIGHFADETDKETFGICFDFDNVRSIALTDLGKWKRIVRLDSPFIEDMLQRYGARATRIGAPDWR